MSKRECETTENVDKDDTKDSSTDCQDNSMLHEEGVGLLLGYAEASRDAPASSLQGEIAQAEMCSPVYSEEGVPANRVAAAWIHHLQMGNALPDRQVLIDLLKGMLQSGRLQSTSTANPGIKLIQTDKNTKKFPHFIDTGNGALSEEDGVWTQCKTKMTHFSVRLCDSEGNSVNGVSLQEGGLRLRLTLHRTSDGTRPLADDDNPRKYEGLFRGRAGNAFVDTICLMESRAVFRFQVMILSSDVGGSQFFVKVAPEHPNLAFNSHLTVRSHSFHSRARMPDVTYHSDGKRQRIADNGSSGDGAGEGGGE
tara:strand:- start:2138 stop:3064 length:927 start_codon:yes stop_codon:yes gene_type:complete